MYIEVESTLSHCIMNCESPFTRPPSGLDKNWCLVLIARPNHEVKRLLEWSLIEDWSEFWLLFNTELYCTVDNNNSDD